ncbi:hypothetical protein EV368DRAFT_63339 [Lentinula lateritia]|nr:hypothetical protein EV368DRAFT_63339 [Lentinula lateritia]
MSNCHISLPLPNRIPQPIREYQSTEFPTSCWPLSSLTPAQRIASRIANWNYESDANDPSQAKARINTFYWQLECIPDIYLERSNQQLLSVRIDAGLISVNGEHPVFAKLARLPLFRNSKQLRITRKAMRNRENSAFSLMLPSCAASKSDSDDFYHMPEMCPNLQHLTILDIPSSHEAQNLISVPPRKLSISSLKARATRLSSQLKLFQATLLSFIAPSLTALLMIGFNKYGLLSKRRKLNFEISAWAVEFFLVYTPTLPCLRSLTLSRSKIFDYEEFISTVRPRWLPDADAASKVGIKCLRSIELYFRHPFQGTDYVPLDLIEESGMRVVVKLESEEMRFFEIDPAEEEINSNAQEENSYEDGSTSELGSDDVE